MAKKKPKKVPRPPKKMDVVEGRRCLLEVADVLDALQLPYFLVQGTALGAYRDNGFTPTEADIDIGFLQELFSPKAGVLASELCNRGFELRLLNRPFSRCRTIVLDRCEVHMDLVSFVRWKDKRFVSRPVDARGLDPYSIVHDHRMIENYDSVSLFGREFLVPSPIEGYLVREYGPDWKTPKLDHVSRTRIYDYRKNEGIPNDFLNAQPQSNAR